MKRIKFGAVGPTRTPKKYAGQKGYSYHPTKGFRKDKSFDPDYKPRNAGITTGIHSPSGSI